MLNKICLCIQTQTLCHVYRIHSHPWKDFLHQKSISISPVSPNVNDIKRLFTVVKRTEMDLRCWVRNMKNFICLHRKHQQRNPSHILYTWHRIATIGTVTVWTFSCWTQSSIGAITLMFSVSWMQWKQKCRKRMDDLSRSEESRERNGREKTRWRRGDAGARKKGRKREKFPPPVSSLLTDTCVSVWVCECVRVRKTRTALSLVWVGEEFTRGPVSGRPSEDTN